jgi:hypothetical protein
MQAKTKIRLGDYISRVRAEPAFAALRSRTRTTHWWQPPALCVPVFFWGGGQDLSLQAKQRSAPPKAVPFMSIWAAVPFLYANSSARDGSVGGSGSAAAELPLVDLDGHALSIGAVGSMSDTTDTSATDNTLLAEDGGSSSLAPVVHALQGRSILSASARLPGRVFKSSRSYWFSVRAVFPLTHAQVSASNSSAGVDATWVRSSFSSPTCLHTPPAAPTPIVVETTTTTIGINFPALSTQGGCAYIGDGGRSDPRLLRAPDAGTTGDGTDGP